MELLFCEKEWHNILLNNIADRKSRDKIADVTFYKKFYEAFDNNGGSLSPEWLTQKANVSEWIERTFLQLPAGAKKDSFKILSLGVGLGIIEEPWIRNGFQVHLQECQESSLKKLRSKFPTVPIYIGDARSVIAPAGTFSLIIFSALDYVFDQKCYGDLLKEVHRLLSPGGKAVCVCASNLPLRAMVFNLKKLTSYKTEKNPVAWGYRRTIGEHIRLGKKTGLTAQKVYIFDNHFHLIKVRHSKLLLGLPTLKSVFIAVEWSKAREKEQVRPVRY
jgi:SAM-dependent methyltransferase